MFLTFSGLNTQTSQRISSRFHLLANNRSFFVSLKRREIVLRSFHTAFDFSLGKKLHKNLGWCGVVHPSQRQRFLQQKTLTSWNLTRKSYMPKECWHGANIQFKQPMTWKCLITSTEARKNVIRVNPKAFFYARSIVANVLFKSELTSLHSVETSDPVAWSAGNQNIER